MDINNLTLTQLSMLTEQVFRYLEKRYSCKYGIKETFIHLVEEIGEVGRAIVNIMTERGEPSNIEEEIVDSLFFLIHLANLSKTDILGVLSEKLERLGTRLGFNSKRLLESILLDKSFPPYPISAVAAYIPLDDKVLLVRRGAEPGRGLWSLPGGAIEIGESAREAIVREVLEEVSIRVEPTKPIGILEVLVRNDGRIKFHYVINVWQAKPLTLKPKPSSDVLEAKWVKPDEMDRMKLSPACRIVVKRCMSNNLPFNVLLKVEDGRYMVNEIC